MDEEYNLSYKIKFGFTENFDNRMKTGYDAYFGKGGYQVLHVYKGDFSKEVDETAIKQYLSEYCKHGKEWFECCQEVLTFFNTYDTPEKLKKKVSEIPVKDPNKLNHYKVDYMLLDYIVHTYHSELNIFEAQDKRVELRDILKQYTKTNQYKYLKEIYDFDLEKFKEYQENRTSNTTDEVGDKISEFNGLKRVNDKIRYMMDFSETASERDLKEFLELVPGKYKDYYTIVGPEIIKSFGCEEYKIKKVWREKLSNTEIKDVVVSEIYKTFHVGQRYTKKNIKAILNDLYERLGYKKKAKATDLELYYYMKPILTPDKQNGFELIGKR